MPKKTNLRWGLLGIDDRTHKQNGPGLVVSEGAEEGAIGFEIEEIGRAHV